MEYQEKLDAAEKLKVEIKSAFKKLYKKKPKAVDQYFHNKHEESFSRIDCLKCANCCKTTSPIFREIDIKRIAKKLKIKEQEFEVTYLRKDEDDDWVLQNSPCAFLEADNTCRIYEYSPQACREYPHTDRKRMHQLLNLTERNAQVCPAVAEMAVDLAENGI